MGFFGYSLRHEKYNSKVLYSQGNKKKIISEINKVKKKVDYIIISLHWGDEYINLPSISQINLAHDINSGYNIRTSSSCVATSRKIKKGSNWNCSQKRRYTGCS